MLSNHSVNITNGVIISVDITTRHQSSWSQDLKSSRLIRINSSSLIHIFTLPLRCINWMESEIGFELFDDQSFLISYTDWMYHSFFSFVCPPTPSYLPSSSSRRSPASSPSNSRADSLHFRRFRTSVRGTNRSIRLINLQFGLNYLR